MPPLYIYIYSTSFQRQENVLQSVEILALPQISLISIFIGLPIGLLVSRVTVWLCLSLKKSADFVLLDCVMIA